MAVFLNNLVGVKINSVDLSDHVTAVTINRVFDELEAVGAHRVVPGGELHGALLSWWAPGAPRRRR